MTGRVPRRLLDPLGNVPPSRVEPRLLRMFSLVGAEPVVPSRGVPAAARAWSQHPRLRRSWELAGQPPSPGGVRWARCLDTVARCHPAVRSGEGSACSALSALLPRQTHPPLGAFLYFSLPGLRDSGVQDGSILGAQLHVMGGGGLQVTTWLD